MLIAIDKSVFTMFSTQVVVLSAVVASSFSLELTFPSGFQFGSASASYQIEGAWNATDKSISIWDYHTHKYPDKIRDHTNGDIACDSYHKWKTDVVIANDLGLDFYRFSVSWVRILPSGFTNHISEDGLRYYNNLIDALAKNGIQSMVTIYHWDLPQKLQDLGGWANPLIVDWFVDYADVLLSHFAERVKFWITINEPIAICDVSYSDALLAPALSDPDHSMYLCNKHVLLAHAKVWRLFDAKYRPVHGGQMSFSNHIMFVEGETESDDYLAELDMELEVGRFSHPIYSKEGGWSPVAIKAVADISKDKGYARSLLPSFTDEEINLMRGTYDFYGVNYYTTRTIRKAKPGEKLKPWFVGDAPEINGIHGFRKEWKGGASSLYRSNPPGLRHTLRWLKKHYGELNFIISENGYSNFDHELDDDKRIEYIRDHLEQILLSIHEDQLNVTHYTYWSMMDNFEWMDGYSVKFGLYEVDFSDPDRTRTPRKSAYYYRSVIDANSIDVPLNPGGWVPSPTVEKSLKTSNANTISRNWITLTFIFSCSYLLLYLQIN